ncbi:MAG: MOSC domain-containing protein [Streptosporangiales bacterium]
MSLGSSPHLASIHIYPLKSGRAVDLPGSRVEPWGLAGDRRWLVVDDTGRFVTQRAEPALALVTAGYVPAAPAAGGPASGPLAAGALTLSAPGRPVLTVPAPAQERGAEMLWVTVWSSRVRAAAAGDCADEWLSRFLGRAVRLVHLDDPTRRGVDPEFGAPADRVSFADGYPLLLTTAGSLDALGRWLVAEGQPPVPMNRFRPNVVVAGAAAWAEDGWRRIQIGTVTFRVAKPCGRCVVTTIDQETAQRGRQPLDLLGRRRRFGQQLVFGQNVIPDAPGTIRVGDRVQILDEADRPPAGGHAVIHSDVTSAAGT